MSNHALLMSELEAYVFKYFVVGYIVLIALILRRYLKRYFKPARAELRVWPILIAFVPCPLVDVVVTNSLFYLTGRSWPFSLTQLIWVDVLPDIAWFYPVSIVSALPLLFLYERSDRVKAGRLISAVLVWASISVGFYTIEAMYFYGGFPGEREDQSIFGAFSWVGGLVASVTYWLIMRCFSSQPIEIQAELDVPKEANGNKLDNDAA
jgi:hypothetical protein